MLLKMLKTSFIVLPIYGYAFDLNDAYTNALEYNADYLAQISRTAAGQEAKAQGLAALLPQVSASAAYASNYLSAAGDTAYYRQPTAGIQLSQVAFDFSRFSQYTKSKYSAQISTLQLENAKQKLMVDVSQAYFDALYAIDTLDALRQSKDAFLKQVDRARKSFEAGVVTITDVNDAQSSYDAAVAQEIQAENDLINKKNILRNLTGLDPEQIQPVVENIHLVNPNPGKVEDWASLAKTGNINIKVAHKQVDMAKEDISIARSGHIPALNVVGGFNYQGIATLDGGSGGAELDTEIGNIPGTPLSDFNTANLGLQLVLPIYSGGAVNSKIRQAHATHKQVKQQLVSVQRQTDQNIKNAFWQVHNGVNIVKAQTQALKSAKVKLDSDKLGYQVGVRNSIELVNSQKNYIQAIQNYNLARYQYLQYRLQLRYLSGQINEKYLKDINSNIKQN
jgi:outer membrane protein